MRLYCAWKEKRLTCINGRRTEQRWFRFRKLLRGKLPGLRSGTQTRAIDEASARDDRS